MVAVTLPGTLADLFGVGGSGRKDGAAPLAKTDRDRLGLAIRGTPQLRIDDIDREVLDALGRALDVRLIEVFAGGWSKLTEIAAYADTRRYPRGERHAVPLARHSISSRHHPTIEVVVDNVTVLRLQLEIALEAQFEALVIVIDGGFIQSMSSGAWSATGTLSCNGTQIKTLKSRRFVFPGAVRFEPAVAISGAGQAGTPHVEQRKRERAADKPNHLQPSRGGARGWTLSGYDENGQAVRFSISPGADGAERTWALGRTAERSDCVIHHHSVSSRHARIRYLPGRGLEICDLGSTNGTKIDGRSIGAEYVALESVRTIKLGAFEMTLSRG